MVSIETGQGKTGAGVGRTKEGETSPRSYVGSGESSWDSPDQADAANRSKDIIAKGVIKRISAPGDLDKKVENASDTEKAAIYAEAGVWYDALEAISNAIDALPDDASLREQRASLLKQVGLPEAAAIDQNTKSR